MPTIQVNDVLQDSRQVSAFKVVAHTTGAYGNTSENHWVIALKLSTGMIRINMRAREYEDPTGVIEWSFHVFTISDSEIASWEYLVKRAVTVQEIARLVYQKGRQRYQMSGGGSGCRWWVSDTPISLLIKEAYENLTFLHPGQSSGIGAAISREVRGGRDNEPTSAGREEKALGEEHPSTLTSVNNLVSVLQDQGKYEEAEAMNRRALEGSEKALGKEHPDTLTSLDNLASADSTGHKGGLT